MAKNCNACSDLQENSADFMQNGVTENVCNALKNDDGFNTASVNDDCADLNNANDCLVGNMTDEIEAYEVCDWKAYTKSLVHNIWTTTKAMICSICGLWTHVHKAECTINAMVEGMPFTVGEDSTDGSYVVAGKGISFLGVGEHVGESQVELTYIAGGLARVQGTLYFYKQNFTDTASCTNFDNGSTESTSASRKGNTLLDHPSAISGDVYGSRVMIHGGELLFEIRILKSQFPQIKALYSGFGHNTAGGEYMVNFITFGPGEYAYGQHGWCNTSTGAGYQDCDNGHRVPNDYFYVQCRMTSITKLTAGTPSNPEKYSPRGFIGIRLNANDIQCD